MTTILLIGSDSTIGSHLKKQLKTQGKTICGTTRHKDRCTETIFFLDLLNPDAFTLPENISIDTVIFCASMSIIKECEDNKALSYQINVESTIKLARYLKNRFDPFIIFLSSNAVFDGSKPFFLETDTPCPINYYGHCKIEAEKKLAGITDKLAILRCTKVLYSDHPLIKKWIQDLQNGEKIYPFDDLMLAPISLEMVSTAIKKLSDLKKPGIFHLSGNNDITYVELARLIAKQIKCDNKLIISTCDTKKQTGQSQIKNNTTLDMTNFKKILGIFKHKRKSQIPWVL